MSVVSQSLPVSHLSGILVIYVVGSVVFVFSIGISMVSMLCFCSMFFFFFYKSNVLGLWCLVFIITWNKRALTTGHVVAVAMVFFGTISNVWKKIINDLKDMGMVMDVWFGVE